MTTLEKIKAEIAKEVEKHYEEWQYVAGLMTAKDIFEKYAEPTTLEQIRAEIAQIEPYDLPCDKRTPKRIRDMALEIVEKYAEQEPTGHWIIEDMFDGDVAYRCSECNELFWLESGTPKDNEYNFCPKCGKKLVEPQERSNK